MVLPGNSWEVSCPLEASIFPAARCQGALCGRTMEKSAGFSWIHGTLSGSFITMLPSLFFSPSLPAPVRLHRASNLFSGAPNRHAGKQNREAALRIPESHPNETFPMLSVQSSPHTALQHSGYQDLFLPHYTITHTHTHAVRAAGSLHPVPQAICIQKLGCGDLAHQA